MNNFPPQGGGCYNGSSGATGMGAVGSGCPPPAPVPVTVRPPGITPPPPAPGAGAGMPGSPPGMEAMMGMNPMMMGMMGMNGMNGMLGGMNPMMMMNNPMMQMGAAMMAANMQAMMAGMGGMGQDAAGSAGAGMRHPLEASTTVVDSRVKALCKEFGIDDKTCETLHEAMNSREDYDEDLQALHMIMEKSVKEGKKPLEVLLTQIRAMKSGRFAGKELLDKDLWAFFNKYNLDDRVLNKLIETLNTRKEKKKDMLDALDKRLGSAQQPTGLGLLVRLLEGLEETGRLPSPPRRLGGSGAFHPQGKDKDRAFHGRDDRRDDRHDRGRDRDRRYDDRRRSRSRSRSRDRR